MSDDESERGGSDAGSDAENEPAFDPSAMDKMSEKDRKKWEANLKKWRLFVDFLMRHVAIATFKYNCFEQDDLQDFMQALEKAEAIKRTTKLKKGEDARISNFKSMRDAAELLTKREYLNEAKCIRKFLDLAGRMKGISMIAGGFFKALKKGNVIGIDKLKHYLEYWKGFCVRSFDYSELTFRGTDPDRFNELERKYLVWPTVIRSSINLSQKFLKRASESTGLELMNSDPKVQQGHMQAAEIVVATRIEDMLFKKVVQESQNFLPGSHLLNPTTPTPPEGSGKSRAWELPPVDEVDTELIKPIPDTGMLLNLPPEPPKEKKKGKKKKKGKGKKGGGRSASASSHKGGKKKKR